MDPPVGRELAVPCAPESALPGLGVGADGALRLTWVEPRDDGHALLLARFDAGHWLEPRTVSRGEDWFVNWADVPSVAADGAGRLLAVWLKKADEDPYAYHALTGFSEDAGKTWSTPRRLHDDSSPTEHGFVSLLARDRGFLAMWLDGRAYADDSTPTAMHVMARSISGDGSMGPEAVLDERACDCCSTALVATADATVASYRDRSPSEVRDIAFARLEGETWGDAAPLHADGWQIDGCPVNGPSLAARAGQVGAAWYTAAGGGAGAVRAVISTAASLGSSQPIAIDSGRPLGRTAAAFVADGRLAVTWLELSEDGADWCLRIIDESGQRSARIVLARVDVSRDAGFARLAPWKRGLVFAWTHAGPPQRVRTVVLTDAELPSLSAR